jgi:RNA polymerase sigma-70 factor (ECF subfamily)
VYRFALRLSRGNEAVAEDLVQDTYLRAYRSWESYTPGTRCRSWLFTICRNIAVRRAESRAQRMEVSGTNLGLEDGSLLSDLGPSPESTLGNPEIEYFERRIDDEVLLAIERLPVEYREAVILCDLEGLAYRDIARMLGVAGGTIKSRIHRGRRILSEALYSYAVEVGYLPADRSTN